MIKLLNNSFKIGAIHLFTQLIFTKGELLIFLQALTEPLGWLLFGMFIAFDFIIIVILVNFFNKILPEKFPFPIVLTGLKILAIAFIGGAIGFIFELIYYKVHYSYLDNEFELSEFLGRFPTFMTYIPLVIVLGELMRLIPKLVRKVILYFKRAFE